MGEWTPIIWALVCLLAAAVIGGLFFGGAALGILLRALRHFPEGPSQRGRR